MKIFQNLHKNMPVTLAIAAIIISAIAFLVYGVNAAGQNTPQGIQGYPNEQLSGDIIVDFQNIDVHSHNVQVELCIDMPTLDPWNPYATLTIDAVTVIPNIEVTLLNAKDPEVMKSQNRCYLFTFPVSTESLVTKKGTLRLEKLWLELGHGQFTDEVVTEIKARMSEVAPGVDFEVVSVSEQGGGGVSIKVISKPENMSDNDVMSLIQQLSIDEISTKWQMEIELK